MHATAVERTAATLAARKPQHENIIMTTSSKTAAHSGQPTTEPIAGISNISPKSSSAMTRKSKTSNPETSVFSLTMFAKLLGATPVS
jgi:hypothetical protein